MKTIKIKPRVDCKACGGTGIIYNSVPVPFGPGNCLEALDCDCVIEQIPEDEPEDVVVELDLSDLQTCTADNEDIPA